MAAGAEPEQWSFTGYGALGAFLSLCPHRLVAVPQGRTKAGEWRGMEVILRVPGWEDWSTGWQKTPEIFWDWEWAPPIADPGGVECELVTPGYNQDSRHPRKGRGVRIRLGEPCSGI